MNLNSELQELIKNQNPRNIVLSQDLRNLHPDISKNFKQIKIFLSSDTPIINSCEKVLCIVDFSNIKEHESTTNMDFEDYLKLRCTTFDEPFDTIYFTSLIAKEQENIIFVSIRKIKNKENVKKFLLACKLTDINFIDEFVVEAKKIKLIKYEFDNGKLVLEQVHDPKMIEKILDFSKNYYTALGFNYRNEIDRLFSKYSNYFVTYKKENSEFLAVARFIIYFPDHYLPCMLATEKTLKKHLLLIDPEKIQYGEFSGIYENSLSGGKAYKESMKNLVKYVYNLEIDGYGFTTYLESDKKTGELYTKSFGFDTFIVQMIYGDFRGIWNLIKGNKQDIFDKMSQLFIKK